MAKCFLCGSETTLFVAGEPVCCACDDKMTKEHGTQPLLFPMPPAKEESIPDLETDKDGTG